MNYGNIKNIFLSLDTWNTYWDSTAIETVIHSIIILGNELSKTQEFWSSSFSLPSKS